MIGTHPVARRPGRLGILHTEWSTGWGGQEIRILGEMQHLREQRDYRFHLACRPGARIAEEATRLGFAVHLLPFRSRLDWRTIWQLRTLTRHYDIDLLHAHSSIDAYCAGLCGRLTGVPVIRSRHLSVPDKSSLQLRLVYDWLAQAVICSSEHARHHLTSVAGCRPAGKVTIRAGVDPHQFHPGVAEIHSPSLRHLRQSLAIPEDARVIGIIAMLRVKKGHLILLDAFARLRQHWSKAHLLVVGDGPARVTIEHAIASRQLAAAVTFTGYRRDIPLLLRLMEISVTPSLEEACSQVVMQAMHCGTPVIVSNAGGLPELVEDGRTGQVVTRGSVTALHQALAHSLQQPQHLARMAMAAREVALRHFTLEHQINATAGLYEAFGGKSGDFMNPTR